MHSLIPVLKAIAQNQLNLDITEMSDELLSFATDTGMGCYLKHCSQNSQKTITTTTKQHLLSAELTAKVITTQMLDALKEIVDSSEQCTDSIILLKGITLSQSYYPKPWFRIMSDIDILVTKNDTTTFENILLQLGYQQVSDNTHKFYENHHHSMPFFNQKNNVWIEVHTHLFSKSTGAKNDDIFTLKQIHQNTIATTNPQYNPNTKQLSAELHLIYTCVHWADDYNSYKSCIQLTDMVLLIINKGDGINWKKINNWLANTNAASSVYLALSYLHKSNIISIPETYFKSVQLKNKNMALINRLILYKIIDCYFLAGKPYGSILTENNIITLWETLLQPKPSFINILLIPVNLLFPPDNNKRFKLSLIKNRLLGIFTKN